jgi:hypothetical protein
MLLILHPILELARVLAKPTPYIYTLDAVVIVQCCYAFITKI